MDRLVAAVRELKEHDADIARFYDASVVPQVRPGLSPVETLKDIFAASVSERRGASRKRGREAVLAFEPISPELHRLAEGTADPAAACQQVFERLCLLPQIDQKIAAMFMKFVVNVFHLWPHFRPHLYVPLDRVVLKLLTTKLMVGRDLPDQSPGVKFMFSGWAESP